jgi:hypothetical protein
MSATILYGPMFRKHGIRRDRSQKRRRNDRATHRPGRLRSYRVKVGEPVNRIGLHAWT